jgi:heptosyltransferase-2
VLVLRFTSLGDVVLTSPAIEALHRAWPDTEIHFVVKAELAPLLEADPRLTAVIPVERNDGSLRTAARLRRGGCDAVLDLHGKVRSRLICALVPARRRAVWHKRPWRDGLPVRLGLRPYRAAMHIAERYHRRGRLQSWVSEDAARAAGELLAAHGIEPGETLIGISPGARWETKRWPVERFADVAARAIREGYRVVLTGTTSERHLAATVREHAPRAVDLCGAADLRTFAALVQRCDAFVANDSGPLHLARSFGVPTVAIFGCTDPAQFAFDRHYLQYAELPCAPCHFYGRRSCPRGHFDCMRSIDAGAVWRALTQAASAGRVPLVLG